MSLTLRDAGPEDVPLVLGFVRRLAAYERQPDRFTATPEAMRQALFGAPPLAQGLLAWRGAGAVGVAIWTRTFDPFAARPGYWLANLFVAEECRGQGIGRAVFAELARRLRDEGGAMIGWGVKRWNAPSIGFYRALGAEHDPGISERMTLSGAALARLEA